ncbi:hypothetical protein [Kineosporia babensis]|uniref:Uncharacterized protein n=1 Tax=Kineosporia babensis TaxID=499548 RepID=A0A9X1NHG4_9ACTN|nr:hypothetical protein [Kineosporia babensis]MCD5315152.1 hypothetical protein [Kineosporia babensis]
MIRVLRIELRRSNVPVVALSVFLVSALVLGLTFREWLRDWSQLAEMTEQAVGLTAALAAAGGAVLGRREKRSRADELFAGTGRPAWQKVAPTAGALSIGLVAVQGLILAAALVLVRVNASYQSYSAVWQLGPDLAVLAGAGLLGLAAGRAWSSAFVAPGLAAGLVLVQVVFSASGVPHPLSFFNSGASTWTRLADEVVLGRAALGAGLLVAGILLAASRNWAVRGLGAGALVAGVAAALVITPVQRFEVDPAARRLVCSEGAPQVCVTAVHAYALADTTRQAREALGHLSQLPDAPQRAIELNYDPVAAGLTDTSTSTLPWDTTPDVAPGTMQFELVLKDGAATDPDLMRSMVSGAGASLNGCRLDDPRPLAVAGAWLTDAPTFEPISPYLRDMPFPIPTPPEEMQAIGAAVAKLRALPHQQQVQRVSEFREALRACRTKGLMDILIAPGPA